MMLDKNQQSTSQSLEEPVFTKEELAALDELEIPNTDTTESDMSKVPPLSSFENEIFEAKANASPCASNLPLTPEWDEPIAYDLLDERQGPGGTILYYISGYRIINILNKFYPHGWSTNIIEINLVDESNANNKVSLGISLTLRLTIVRANISHEDVGFGNGDGKTKREAYEKAVKEARTDALKRCARNLGDALGNCVYNKKYLTDAKNKRGRMTTKKK